MSVYDKYYKNEKYFGNPYPELLTYFKKLDKKLSILDIGCGQGRDAITLGRLGFRVVGLDLSEVGLDQMNEVSKQEKLEVVGHKKNLYEFDEINQYDVILLDSMFHFYKKDLDIESHLMNKFLSQLKMGGRMVIIVQYNKNRVSIIQNLINQSDYQFTYEHEEVFLYKEFNSRFYFISVRKNDIICEE